MEHTDACLAGIHAACTCTRDKLDAVERFWLGPVNREESLIYRQQLSNTESKWTTVKDGTTLDPSYSEFSVRIHDPHARSLSFINRTIAILPKSRLRTIYALIGRYLNEHDAK
jgi:hypothetical protein